VNAAHFGFGNSELLAHRMHLGFKPAEFGVGQNVATVKGKGGLVHCFENLLKINVAEFIPLGHHSEGMGAVDSGKGVSLTHHALGQSVRGEARQAFKVRQEAVGETFGS